MTKDTITYSSDHGKICRKDLDETSKIAEEYFGMERDQHQIPATSENRDWVYAHIPNYLNIIRSDSTIIGYAFLLPCNRTLMEDFIHVRIDEATLFEEIKKLALDGVPDALYLCASVVKAGFRRRGLSTTAFVKAIHAIIYHRKRKPILFYWAYSKEGGRLAKKIAAITGLELRKRE